MFISKIDVVQVWSMNVLATVVDTVTYPSWGTVMEKS